MAWAFWNVNLDFQPYSLARANALLTRVRDAGVIVHAWP
jgi:hypothetical protein